ncbi:MAG: homing endonuclease associated repeat-containing protein [Actinomycetota bacterium]
MLSNEQILHAIREAAGELGRTPSKAEFLRMSKIKPGRLDTDFRGYRGAVRAAGLKTQSRFKRLDAWTLMEDWARVARLCGRLPAISEYFREGRHSRGTLARLLGKWSEFGGRFAELVEQYGRREEYADVLAMIQSPRLRPRNGRPRKNAGAQVMIAAASEDVSKGESNDAGNAASNDLSNNRNNDTNNDASQAANPAIALEQPVAFHMAPVTVLPPQLQGRKRVPPNMWPFFLAMVEVRTAYGRDLMGFVAMQPFSDRPVQGTPLRTRAHNAVTVDLDALPNEPVNEMGVMCLFVLLAKRMGFIIDVVRAQFPDCEARYEVEPGRWQRVWIEFEFESIAFRRHRHDPAGCDIIVCWRHNWADCPKHLKVIELSRIVAA